SANLSTSNVRAFGWTATAGFDRSGPDGNSANEPLFRCIPGLRVDAEDKDNSDRRSSRRKRFAHRNGEVAIASRLRHRRSGGFVWALERKIQWRSMAELHAGRGWQRQIPHHSRRGI